MGDLILEVSKLKTGSRQNELMDQFDPLVPLEAIPDPGQKRILEMLVEGEKTLCSFHFVIHLCNL